MCYTFHGEILSILVSRLKYNTGFHFFVENKGIKNGEPKTITGKAKQPNSTKFPGKLKVSFFLWFYSDYYILEVGADYDYVLVGSSTDKYLWIMYREKQMPQQLLDELLEKLRARGYDTGRLLFVNQK